MESSGGYTRQTGDDILIELGTITRGDSQSLTVVIKYTVENSRVDEFLETLDDMSKTSHSQFKGHLYAYAVKVPRGHKTSPNESIIMSYFKFDNLYNLRVWISSPERKPFATRLTDIAPVYTVEILEGLANFYDLSDEAQQSKSVAFEGPPPKWKETLIVIWTVYALLVMIHYTFASWTKLADKVDTLLNIVIVVVSAVPFMHWIILPTLSVLLESWLKKPYPDAEEDSFMDVLNRGLPLFRNINKASQFEYSLLSRVSKAESRLRSALTRLDILENGLEGVDFSREDFKIAADLHGMPIEAVKAVHARSGELPVTVSVSHNVHFDFMSDYENWMKTTSTRVHKVTSGYLGIDVLRPGSLTPDGYGTYTVTFTFDSNESLMAWLDSTERIKIIASVQPFIQCVSLASGNSKPFQILSLDSFFNFGASSGPLPPWKWKTMIMTDISLVIVLYTSAKVLGPLVEDLAFPFRAAILNTINVTLTGYVVAPLVGLGLSTWVKHRPQDTVATSQPLRTLQIGLPWFEITDN